MEEELIINQENIEEQKSIDIFEKEEYPKELNSSLETSQYEKCVENEDKCKEHIPQNVVIEEQTPQKKEEKNVRIKGKNQENISTYILPYSRSKEELKEVTDTTLKKSEKCSYMLNFKLIPIEDTKKDETPNEKTEYYLVISCHEIAAFYFDEIYERVYKLEELNKENKYFRIFENTVEIKAAIDEFIIKNEKNKNKFFIEFKDKELKIHMKFSFFDKEQEIILNIQKKVLSVKEKANLLPEFLKEIQHKMIYLCERNKMIKKNNLSCSPKTNELHNKIHNEINDERFNNSNYGILKKNKGKF